MSRGGADFIFEGVWDGNFAEHSFDSSDFTYGSGATFRKNNPVVFVPPKHCWEFLFVIHDKEQQKTYVSNSMNYIFVAANIKASSKFFNEVIKVIRSKTDEATAVGIDLYDQLVYENSRYSFYRMMFYNFTVNGQGEFKLHPSLPKRLFTGFDEYKHFLLDKIDRIAKNGSDPSRQEPQTPLTLISSGYDSPCVGALASSLGYKDAATIAVTVKGRDDSGKDIAKKLGMNVVAVEHPLGKTLSRLAASFTDEKADEIAEFVATPGFGDDIMLKTLESELKDKIYLSGAMGDSAWRRACVLPPGLPVRVTYGKSFTEFRLRVGYSFVPVPAFGARFVWPIKRMTKSSEMSPYILWQPYDRPFPRRIVEEAGIERGSFARAKAATNPTVMNYEELIKPSVRTIMKRYKVTDTSATKRYTVKNRVLLQKVKQRLKRSQSVVKTYHVVKRVINK